MVRALNRAFRLLLSRSLGAGEYRLYRSRLRSSLVSLPPRVGVEGFLVPSRGRLNDHSKLHLRSLRGGGDWRECIECVGLGGLRLEGDGGAVEVE